MAIDPGPVFRRDELAAQEILKLAPWIVWLSKQSDPVDPSNKDEVRTTVLTGPCNPEKAARNLVEIANSVQPRGRTSKSQ